MTLARGPVRNNGRGIELTACVLGHPWKTLVTVSWLPQCIESMRFGKDLPKVL